jgi:hypothetical protein
VIRGEPHPSAYRGRRWVRDLPDAELFRIVRGVTAVDKAVKARQEATGRAESLFQAPEQSAA